MLIESVIIGFVTIGAMYYVGDLNILIYGLTVLAYISSSVSIYLMTESDSRGDPTETMKISSVKYIILSAVFVIGILSYGYTQEQLTLIYYISTGVFAMYTASVVKRSQKYEEDRDYFTDQYSSANKDWKRASVALEMALDSREENVNQSYFWAKRAESIYEGIIEKEDRVMQREAAGAFATACGFVAASVFTESNESYSLWKAAEKSIQQARNLLSVRICDMCGQKKPVENCTGSLEDGERKVYCQRCIDRQQKKNRRQASHQQQETNSDGYTRKDSTRRNRSSNDNSSNSSSNGTNSTSRTRSSNSTNSNRSQDSNEDRSSVTKKNDSEQMTTEEALQVLDLKTEPNSASGVHEAFRSKVKKAHPDMGGSEEKFREVKKAREILVKKY